MRTQLILSDIEEYLGKDPAVLLGSCCAHDQLHHTCVEPVIDRAEAIVSASETCRSLYEEILPVLALRINQELSIDISILGYRLILGNWLRNFIETVHERHVNLLQAFKLFPESYIANTCPPAGILVNDYPEFQKHLQTTSYNRLLFLQIIKEIAPERFEGTFPPLPEDVHILKNNWTMGDRFLHFFHRLRAIFPKRYVLVCNATLPYFSRFGVLRFLLQGGSTFAIDHLKFSIECRVPVRHTFRHSPLDLSGLDSRDSLRGVISTLVPQNLPVFFLEALPEITRLAKRIPVKKISAVYTNFGIHNNTLLKVFLATCEPRPSLLCHQHGGRYCIDAIHFPFEYEREVATKVLLWGRDERGTYVPSIKLRPQKPIRKDRAGLLLGLTSYNRYHQRYVLRPQGGPYRLSQYHYDTQQLVASINPSISITIRSSADVTGLFSRPGRDLHYDKVLKPFDREAPRYALYCVDHLGTTMLESISLGIPTVVVIEKRLTMYHPDAQGVMVSLEQAGIIHYCPVSAAAFINERFSTIDEWWQSEAVQTALTTFRRRFAWPSHTPEKDLISFFCSQSKQERDSNSRP